MRVARHKARASTPPFRGAVVWLAVCLTVFAALPGMMSGNYLPKIFWVTVTVGIGLALLPPFRREKITLTLLGGVWLAYLGWALLSLSWALQPRVGFERWLVMIVLTLAYLLAGRTRFWESRFFWRGFSLVTALVALIGILQYYFPAFTPVNYFPGTAVPRGTMGHRNYAGMYFMVTLPFLAWFYFSARGKEALPAFAALLLGTGFLLLVKSRGAWIGLGAGAVFFVAAGGGSKIIARKARIIWLGVACLSAGAVAVLIKPPAPVAGLMADKADFVQTARALLDPANRLEMWREVPGITPPLTGAGFGNFPIVATPRARDVKVKTLNWEVHNDYLQAYVDLGIPGAALFLAVFLILLWTAWRERGRGLILAAGASIVGLSVIQLIVFTMEVVSSQVWIAGAAALLNREAGLSPVRRFRVPGRIVITANYLAVLSLLILAGIIGFTIRGDREFRRGREKIEQVLAYRRVLRNPDGYPEATLSQIRRELEYARPRLRNRLNRLTDRVLPTMLFDSNMRHITCHQFAGLAWNLEYYPQAEKFARRALELHPNDRTALTYLTAIALREGRGEEAFNYLKQGVEIFGYNPYHPFFPEYLAQLLRFRGDTAAADSIEEKLAANLVSSPSNPFPPNQAGNVPTRVILEWDNCPAANSYDVFILSAGERSIDRPRFSGLRENRLRREISLKPGTTYIWRVRAVGRYGEELGDLWYFRTKNTVDSR